MSTNVNARSGRRSADLLLFGVTTLELLILFRLSPGLTIADWIYVSRYLLVLGIAMTRGAPRAQDRSLLAGTAVVVAYSYSYAQVIYLNLKPGVSTWPRAGLVMVVAAAVLSLTSVIALGKRFGIRPALRGVMAKGPYAFVRHPMYLSYFVSDVGYNLQEGSIATVLLTLAGWAALLYRIHAEERVLAQDPTWSQYSAHVRYRLLPGIW